MGARSRGQGGGPKRRLRTRLRKVGGKRSNVVIVTLNSSIKRAPSNWRELYVYAVAEACRIAPGRIVGRLHAGQAIPEPHVSIPPGSTPDIVIFSLQLKGPYAQRQRRVIDYVLTMCDVHQWPVPRVNVHRLSAGDVAVATNLPLRDWLHTSLESDRRHWINVGNYSAAGGGLEVSHIEPYVVRRGKGRYVGVRTKCGQESTCRCRSLLPEVWHLGWEMHL